MRTRIATEADLDGIVNTLAGAFEHDPLWGWAFPESCGIEDWWRLFVSSALEYPDTWIADDFAAVAVWIPPGGDELTEVAEAAMEPMLNEKVGSRAKDVLDLVERFDRNHPHDPPHYYLTLLGTHPDQRGKGLGMGLLARCLELIDKEGAPAYLESSNPANIHRYEKHGFAKVGEFERPDGKSIATTMWRESGS